jgi:membrane-associated phospholipid phosphatase
MDGSAAPTSGKGVAHKIELGLVCAGLYAVVGSLALRVRGGTAPLRVDRAVSNLVGSARMGNAVARTHVAALLPRGISHDLVGNGLALGAALVAGLAALALLRRDLRAAALCLAGPALAVVLTDSVLKPLIDRRHGVGLAYPSGHATGAAAVAALSLVLFHRWGGWRSTAWFTPVAVALPLAMGLALVRLGYHYPTDVVGGTAMGVATVIALAVLVGAEGSAIPPAPAPPSPD